MTAVCDWESLPQRHLHAMKSRGKLRSAKPQMWRCQRCGKIIGSTAEQEPRWDHLPLCPNTMPFVAVVGLHSSGTSALAGVLHHLGVWMGGKLIGYYGNDPDTNCGFETRELQTVVRSVIHWPLTSTSLNHNGIGKRLKPYVAAVKYEAAQNGSAIAGGKHPMLSMMGIGLEQACGDSLIVVDSHRPLEESIASFIRREGLRPADRRFSSAQLKFHQEWLWEKKQAFLARHPNHLRVAYGDLLNSTRDEVDRIAGHLKLQPTPEQIEKAIAWVDPSKQHVNLSGESESGVS